MFDLHRICLGETSFVLADKQEKIPIAPFVRQDVIYEEQRCFMDTVIALTIYGPWGNEAGEAVFKEFARIEKLCSRFDPTSQLSLINHAAGEKPVRVNLELIAILQEAKELSALLSGAFDITIGAVTSLWGIGHHAGYVPTEAEIKSQLALVDYRKLLIQGENVFLPEAGMKLDLGGFAKEYALHQARLILKAYGVKDALVNAGGDICTIGCKRGGVPWRIGVQHPRKQDELIARLTLTQWDTVETSGDYRRFYVYKGQRYAHLFNPFTGKQPSDLCSVTLIYHSGLQKHRLPSSGVLMLGLEEGLSFLKDFPGMEAFFVTQDSQAFYTPGLKDRIEL